MWGHVKLISAGIGWTVKVLKFAKKMQKQYKASRAVVAHAAMLSLEEDSTSAQDGYIAQAKADRGVKNGK